MIPYLFLALALAAPQEGALDRARRAVTEYVAPRTKPEDRLRMVERLGAMGPASVGFLRTVTDGPGRAGVFPPARHLVGDVKADLLRRLGDEFGARAILRLRSESGKIEATEALLETILDELRRQGLGPVLLNPAEYDELSKIRFSVRASGDPMDLILERLLTKHRLDYYARGHVVVIATRDWLWGFRPPGAADDALQARVAEALAQLDSEFLDRRAASERTIIESGPAAIPLLEQATGLKRERMDQLVDRIYARHVPDRLHPADAEPGLISEDAHEFHRATRDRTISISFFKPTPLSEILARIAEFSETPVALDAGLPGAIAGRKLTLAMQDVSVHDLLEALAVPLGAAVRPEAARLVVVPRR